ncbi:uncharacterized protein LOC133173648 [Saccostrea echinata]|uniref:uncharacterized protein LOC133173648 n=1 Tax=Saccostrea echinata TaxID=191078 RepID=UPI002A7EEBC1|nr:uncharacterized protein LOC133173648 [Saccostrea echinata]XP_061164618.1 uncharacterized protein LOC133173648 [Saccostrea echinata]
MHKTAATAPKRQPDLNLPSLKRHTRSNIQKTLQEIEGYVPTEDLEAAKLEYIGLVQAEQLLKERYPPVYQDVLISGIMEAQKSPRHGPENSPKSRLREVLMVACREPSVNKYTSGTALYEYNSLKRSEKMLLNMQNKVELPQKYLPKRMTIMEVSPRVKHGKKTSRGETHRHSVTGSSISDYEDVLRTVEFQQTKIDQLTKRLGGGLEEDETALSKALKITKRFRDFRDKEYASAFHEMSTWNQGKDTEIMYNLMRIIRYAYPFCQTAAYGQLLDLTTTSAVPLLQPIKLPYLESSPTREQRLMLSSKGMKYVKGLRQEVATISVPQLCKKFKETTIEKDFRWDHTKLPSVLNDYIDKCIEILWLMCVQDPPMALVWPSEGDRVDRDKYDFYSESGKYVSMCVWPAVLIQEGRKVLSKGSIIATQK